MNMSGLVAVLICLAAIAALLVGICGSVAL